MKARVLFGVFGFAFVLLALYVFPPIVLELVVAALCVFATYEVLGSTKLVRNHLELLLAMAVSLGLAVGHFSILPLRLESVMRASTISHTASMCPISATIIRFVLVMWPGNQLRFSICTDTPPFLSVRLHNSIYYITPDGKWE